VYKRVHGVPLFLGFCGKNILGREDAVSTYPIILRTLLFSFWMRRSRLSPFGEGKGAFCADVRAQG
jgi:hypothetical protein